MALRQAKLCAQNGPGVGKGDKGVKGVKARIPVTGLQRQALGNMANKRGKHPDTKKPCKPQALPQGTVAETTKAEAKPTQLTKAKRPLRNARAQQKQPSQGNENPLPIIAEQDAMETESTEAQATRQRPRTPTPQPMDVMEVACELGRKLQLDDETDQEEEDLYACTVYADDIYSYLRQLERELQPSPDYMSRQPRINQKMRAILIDWLVLVHMKFSLLQETLYLTVAIIDRFLEVFPASKDQLQLVGVTAMFLAAKYEEVYFPEIGDFIYITDDSYTSEQIRQMERIILRTVGYNLSSPGAIQFLRRYSKIAKTTVQAHVMAKYFMELTLINYNMLKYLPSQLAAASLCLAMESLHVGDWSPILAHHTRYTSSDLQPIKDDLALLVLSLPLLRQQAIKDKYSTREHLRVAKHVSLSSQLAAIVKKTSGSSQ